MADQQQPQQPGTRAGGAAPAPPASPSAMPGKMVGASMASAGIGAVAVVMALLKEQPLVVQKVMDWSLTVIILAFVALVVPRLLAPFIAAQERIARGQEHMADQVGDLTGAVRDSLSRDYDVRAAMREMSAEFTTLVRELREWRAACPVGHKAGECDATTTASRQS